MSFPIIEFSVYGLLGNKNYSLKIKDQATIIVGPNGSGKSNFLNILYYVISKQWFKLYELEFDKINIKFKEDEIFFNKDELASFFENFPDGSRYKEIYEFLEKTKKLSQFIAADKLSYEERKEYSERIGCGTLVIDSLHKKIKNHYINSDKIIETSKLIDAYKIGPIIYMPTYRRIEKIVEQFQPVSSRRRLYEETSPTTDWDTYIEVVSAGMDDVKKLINTEIQSISVKKQKEIEHASQEYILDIVRGKVKNFSTKKVKSLKIEEFRYFIKNLDDKVFSPKDAAGLETKITNLINRNSPGKPTIEEQYLSLYVEKLLNAQEKNKEHDAPLLKLSELAKKYIGNDKDFDFLKTSNFFCKENSKIKPVELDGLSSGEKQLLSIFSYLLLSKKQNYCLIIDEPELSLSVPWQKTLLPDILKTGSCSHIFAVTHSPFIFSNELESCITDTQSMVTEE